MIAGGNAQLGATMGHSTIHMTFDTHGHIFRSREKKPATGTRNR